MSFLGLVCSNKKIKSFRENQNNSWGISAQQLVKDITEIVIRHQTESLLILKEIEDELQTKIFSFIMKMKFLKSKKL
jgi:hypothetical protein